LIGVFAAILGYQNVRSTINRERSRSSKSLGMDVSRIRVIFSRSGEEGKYTKFFENFTRSQQNEILQNCDLDNKEVPVIAYQNENWLLVTNQRLIASFPPNFESFYYDEISDVTFDKMKTIRKRTKRVPEIEDIEILLSGGNRRSYIVEPGYPFSGLWNVLKSLSVHRS